MVGNGETFLAWSGGGGFCVLGSRVSLMKGMIASSPGSLVLSCPGKKAFYNSYSRHHPAYVAYLREHAFGPIS